MAPLFISVHVRPRILVWSSNIWVPVRLILVAGPCVACENESMCGSGLELNGQMLWMERVAGKSRFILYRKFKMPSTLKAIKNLLHLIIVLFYETNAHEEK